MRPGSAALSAAATAQVSERFYTGSGYAIGLELLAQKKAGDFSAWVSYTDAPASVRISKLIPYRSDVTFSGEDVDRLHVEITDETENTLFTLLPQGGGGFGGGGMPSAPSAVAITWSNPNRDYYLVAVDNVADNPAALRDSTAGRSFITELTQDSIVQLSSQQFAYTGRHIVRLCHLQPEYVVMSRASAASRSEPLTEIHANVANGFGVFTGVACHRTEITVHK
jgi:hypothetical protein